MYERKGVFRVQGETSGSRHPVQDILTFSSTSSGKVDRDSTFKLAGFTNNTHINNSSTCRLDVRIPDIKIH